MLCPRPKIIEKYKENMFSNLADTFNDTLGIILSISALIFAVSYAVSQWRKGTSQANAEAVTAYKAEIDAIKLNVERLQGEVKELQKQNNMLKGENEALKNTLNFRDPSFIKQLAEGFDSMKEMLNCLQAHDVQAKDIQKDVTTIREDTTAIRGDLDEIHSFCDNTIKPFIAKAS